MLVLQQSTHWCAPTLCKVSPATLHTWQKHPQNVNVVALEWLPGWCWSEREQGCVFMRMLQRSIWPMIFSKDLSATFSVSKPTLGDGEVSRLLIMFDTLTFQMWIIEIPVPRLGEREKNQGPERAISFIHLAFSSSREPSRLFIYLIFFQHTAKESPLCHP